MKYPELFDADYPAPIPNDRMFEAYEDDWIDIESTCEVYNNYAENWNRGAPGQKNSYMIQFSSWGEVLRALRTEFLRFVEELVEVEIQIYRKDAWINRFLERTSIWEVPIEYIWDHNDRQGITGSMQ